MINKLKNVIKEKIANTVDISNDEIKLVISTELLKSSEKNYIEYETRKKLEKEIYDEIIGYGKIEEFLNDVRVTEIMINGIQDVFIEKEGILEKTNITFTKVELDIIIQKIVSQVNKSINVSNPIVDARLKNGARVNIVMPPIALNGPIVTIRKFSKKILDGDDLIKKGSITLEIEELFKNIIKNKKNIFISGGTGSGKTTLLNVLSNYIDSSERIITIEDSAELQINKISNIVKLEARSNNIEGTGEITIRDLIRTSLRMRPDRIIVGEVRGKETFDMLQAMNTGHSGSLSTGHANSAKDMLTRLESMIIMNLEMPLEAIKRQIASAIDFIIHIARYENGERKVEEIVQILGYENGKYHIHKIYEYDCVKKTIKKIGDVLEK